MKIIYLENVRIPSERAHAYQIVQTCAAWARAGHEVTLVNPSRAEGKNVFAFFGLGPDAFAHVPLESFDPLSWQRLPGFLKGAAYVTQRWAFLRALRRWTTDRQADVWYTRDPAMVEALMGNGRKIALELHDSPTSNLERWERIKGMVSLFVSISKGMRGHLMELGVEEARIIVAPDGFNPEEFTNLIGRKEAREAFVIPENAFVAIYTGGLYPWKGVDLVVKAWAKTAERAHLLILGGTDGDRRRIESLVDSAVASRVHIKPAVGRKQAIQALSAADVGLLTTSSEHEIGRRFTSPLKQFEYLAAGLPVIASDVPSSREVLTDDVARFYPSSEDGFVQTLAAAMADEAWRVRAHELASVLVVPYTWQARAEAIIRALLSRLTD